MPMPRDVVILSDEQFSKLVELLTPGFECAKLMLADYQAKAAASAPTDLNQGDGQPGGLESGKSTFHVPV